MTDLEALIQKLRELAEDQGGYHGTSVSKAEARLLIPEIDRLRAMVPPPVGVPDDPDMLSEFTEDELPRF